MINRDDLVARFGSRDLLGFENALGAGSTDAAIKDATEEAESYIAVQYSLPLIAVPEVLKGKLCDIARYRLMSNRATEEASKRYDNAIAWLRRLSRKEVILNLPPAADGSVPPTQEQGGRIVVGSSDYGGVFGKATTDKMPTL